MTDSTVIAEVTPYPGLRYTARVMQIDADNERRLLGLCGIDPAIYRDCVDPSTFISLAIQEGVRNGISSNGGVNMLQGLVQTRPLRMDESITVSGEIVDVRPSARGRVTASETWYHGHDKQLCITSRRTSLKTDPTVYADPALRGAGERPAPVIADTSRLRRLGQFTLTPDNVKGYGLNTTNAIHFDEDAARRAGYRAPIIGGGHGVRFLTAALWQEMNPHSLDVDIYFRRPIFWDDRVDILVDDSSGRWTAMCLAKDGKVATEMRINALAN
jgi:acyl dehydratase